MNNDGSTLALVPANLSDSISFADPDTLFKEPPLAFRLSQPPSASTLEAQPEGEAGSRAAGSMITVLIDGDANWPFAHGWVLANGTTYMLDAQGRVQIPHSGAFQLEIWSENHAARVVDGQNPILHPFVVRYDVPQPGTWSCPIKQQQWGFYVAATAMRPYLYLQRAVPGWNWHKVMTRLVFPDGAFPETFCEPKSIVVAGVNKPFDEKPLIHLKDHKNWQLIETHIVEEFAHAIHFLELTVAQRHDITWRYLDWLKREVFSGGDARHDYHKRTDELVAYLEGWDAYFTNKVLPGLVQFQEATVLGAFHANLAKISAGDGANWEVCVAALLHQMEKLFGFAFVLERYARSRAVTFADFKAAWQREAPSSYAWLVTEARKWQLPA